MANRLTNYYMRPHPINRVILHFITHAFEKRLRCFELIGAVVKFSTV